MLSIEHLTVRYDNTVLPAVNDVSLDMRAGESVCVVGESGSGKSTLALASMRLLGPQASLSGKVHLDGEELLGASKETLRRIRGRDVGFVFQDALSSFNAYWTVGEQIAETVRAHTDDTRAQAWERAIAQLAAVQVKDPERVAHSYPHELSGGQRQRAAIAMAIVLRPRLLIADEPTSALDVTTAAHILALLRRLQRELSISILLITHDMRVVEAVGDRMAVMYAGMLGELGERAAVAGRPRFPYTRALIGSLDLTRPRGALMGVAGAPPGLSMPLPGCPFAPRCGRARGLCTDRYPTDTIVGASRVKCHFPYGDEDIADRA